jgi:hypothetical protein
MFGRRLSKGIKNIAIDPIKSHIFLKDTTFSLVIIRPYDLVQLSDLVGSGSEDILIWTGKNIGKSLTTKILSQKKKIMLREKLIEELMTNLTNLGYGKFKIRYGEGQKVKIEITNSIVQEIDDKEEAKLIINFYNGIFIGFFNSTGIDVEMLESLYSIDKEPIIHFEYELIELPEED